MPIFQSNHALGIKQAPVCGAAGAVVTEVFEVTAAPGAADVVELGILPAYAFPVDAVLITDVANATITADVGLMSGDVGDPDDTRTVGAEFFNDTSIASAGTTRMSLATGFAVARTNKDRSIGLKVSGATASTKFKLILSYRQ